MDRYYFISQAETYIYNFNFELRDNTRQLRDTN